MMDTLETTAADHAEAATVHAEAAVAHAEAEVAHVEDLRGSAPVMSTKELLIEVWRDMKFVRPAVEGLLAAGVVARIEAIERDDLASKAVGINDKLVQRVVVLEGFHEAATSAGLERRRLGDLTNRSIALVILVSNFTIGLIVLGVNVLG